MNLELSDDQVALRDELRRFLADRCPPDVRRAAIDRPGAVDRDLWSGLAEMGVFALTRPDVGLGLAEAAIAFEELGRVAAPGPAIATFLAAGTAGVDGPGLDGQVVGLVERAAPAVVEHLDGIDALLVLDAGGVSVATPPEGHPAVERPLDPLTPVTVLPELPAGERVGDAEAAERARRDGALLAAAMQVGLGQAALDLAVEYAKSRTQFGRAIGSFQALKHLLADAAVGVEIARAAVHAAAVGIDEGDDRGVASARIVASGAAHRATTTCIQVHGGMGYTWELDAHLFLKRALVLDRFPATPDAASEAIALRL